MIDCCEIVNEHIGKKWVSGARGPNEFDCWGLLLYVLKNNFGMDIEEKEYHIHGKDTLKITKEYEKAVGSKNWEKREVPHDGYAVALSKGKKIHHAGVWVAGGCLHAFDGSCVVHNNLFSLHRNGFKRIEFYKWQK